MNLILTVRPAQILTCLLSIGFLSMGMAGFALAEDEASAQGKQQKGSSQIEEVVVTATYRKTKLMDTPQAVSALTSELIENLGAQSMDDVYTMVPGLSMQGTADGNNRYTVRGVTSQTGDSPSALTGSTVGVYIDGTPVTAALGPASQVSGTLFDIERVEVLKGPQGTLFGESSQGGTIRYLYKQPDRTGFDAAVNLGYSDMAESSDNSTRLDAMINIPISEQWAIRLNGWDAESAGFIDSPSTNEPDYNTATRRGGRAALRFDSERLTVTGTIQHSEQGTEGSTETFRAYESNTTSIVGVSPESQDEFDIYSLVVETDFSFANFQSLTSYTERDISARRGLSPATVANWDYLWGGATLAQDTEFCATDFICQIGYGGVFNTVPGLAEPGTITPDGRNIQAMMDFNDSYSKRWVQEFRLVSPGDRRFRWTAGAVWKDSEDHTQFATQLGVLPGRELFGQLLTPHLNLPTTSHTDTLEEFAVFGEISYDFTDTLEATVGVRVSDLKQDFTMTNSGTDDRPVSPKLVVTWRPRDELMTYFSYTTGFRPGNVNNMMQNSVEYWQRTVDGINNAPGLTPEEKAAAGDPLLILRDASASHLYFDSDYLHSYELGLKTTLWDGRVRIMTSVYTLDWKDMIQVESDPVLAAASSFPIYNINSGGAEINGFELEVNAYVTDRLSVRLAGDVVDTKVTQSASFAQSAEDNELIYAPDSSVSLAVDYLIPLPSNWQMMLHADWAWSAEQWADSANTLSIPSYTKTNARITLRNGDDRWRIALYGTNLSNDEILRGRTATTIPSFFWHNPRQIGLEVGYRL